MQEMALPTRTCVVCGGDKPVSGVWYLLPPRGRGSPFVCESCFRLEATL